jgi:hypothetical protein
VPTIAQIEAQAATRITALSATQHDMLAGTLTWKRSPLPLTAAPLEALRTHLSFSVSIESASARDEGDNEPGREVSCLGELRVVFVYRIRPGAQADDYALASEAAREVLGTLCAYSAEWAAFPAQVWRPGPIVNGFMDVELRLIVAFDLPISPSFAAP